MGHLKPARSNSWWVRATTRTKLFIVGGVLAVAILVLGLGLGLGLRDNDSSDDTIPQTSSPPSTLPTNSSTPGNLWQPAVESSWQIVLIQPLALNSTATSTTPNVDIFDIDLFDNPKSTFDQLHKLGKKAICYFSAGSLEPNRPDSGSFKASDKGKELDGWPGEYWLDLNSTNVREIMSQRIQLAAQKGCDAIDPDNIDGYVSRSNQSTLLRILKLFLTSSAHRTMIMALI
jgi:hypothetical protein